MAHRKLIRTLVAEIRRLRTQAEGLNDELSDLRTQAEGLNDELSDLECRTMSQQEAAGRQASRCRTRIAELEREAEDARYREYERDAAMRELERARSWQDEYGEQRAVEKLKRIG
ncbi:MAG: hypothetical protein AMJ38_00600 [Dehalococcoidia bacterium DG_22]|nr:MAG: hypothetical protein AMJ38_00600 [Dehalococcoidia bacterium DG_22]